LGVGHTLWAKSKNQVNNHKATCQLKNNKTKQEKPIQNYPLEKPPLVTARVAHALPRKSPIANVHQLPTIATSHSKKKWNVVIKRGPR
jgi:hypothetical protein